MKLRAGDIVHLTREASPQFVAPIFVRVIRELTDRYPYPGWLWLEGYQLDARGNATARRELYVFREGVRLQRTAPERPAAARQPIRRTPVRVG